MSPAGSPAGKWVLILAAVEPGNTATIDLVTTVTGTEPDVHLDPGAIRFVHGDGRVHCWAWAALLSACFTPPEPVYVYAPVAINSACANGNHNCTGKTYTGHSGGRPVYVNCECRCHG